MGCSESGNLVAFPVRVKCSPCPAAAGGPAINPAVHLPVDDIGGPGADTVAMSVTDYLLNGVLVAMVFLQVRGRRLTVRLLLLPVAVVAWVAVAYLHQLPTAGDDIPLVVLGALAGLALGTACGLATRILGRSDGAVVAKASVLAAVLWVLGVGARVAFALYATHGGGPAVERFSVAHHITSSQAWVDCLILMALFEVVSRTAVLAARYWRLGGQRPAPAFAQG